MRPIKKKTFVEKIKEADGLGDIVAAVTSAVGIEPCESCEERRKKMNDMFSFIKGTRRQLTEEELLLVEEIEQTKRIKDANVVVKIYNELYGTHIVACNCPGLYEQLMQRLSKQKEYQSIK